MSLLNQTKHWKVHRELRFIMNAVPYLKDHNDRMKPRYKSNCNKVTRGYKRLLQFNTRSLEQVKRQGKHTSTLWSQRTIMAPEFFRDVRCILQLLSTGWPWGRARSSLYGFLRQKLEHSTRQSCRVCMSEIIKWGGQKVQKNPRDGHLEGLIEEILALIEKLPSL